MATGNVVGDPSNADGRRDDRVLLLTRITAGAVIVVLVLAVWILYFYPDTTDQNFSWTIAPRLTAMALGAGYTMGIYFFLRVLTARRWHSVAIGFLPITAFTIFMALATIVHADRFHAGAWNFILWSVIYAITPFLVPFLWWRNQKTAPRAPSPDERLVPLIVRRVAAAEGVVFILLGVLAFLIPDLAIGVFPWKLTPLTARVLAGWAMLPGVGGIVLSLESRWSSWQVVVESFTVGVLFFALALPRAWNDLAPGALGTWILLAFVVGILVVAPVFYVTMQSRRVLPSNSAQRGPA
ncbi:MAG: hypothetical protein WCF84_27090 [Anaerolineae bacterium]